VSGRIIFRPESEHRCAPGWKNRPPLKEGNTIGFPAGTVTSVPPSASEFPVGTRWQCDCGRVWVSRKPPRQNPRGGQWVVNPVHFTPEHWWERRRRGRKTPSEPLKGGDVD
jgi:hypothetical protein